MIDHSGAPAAIPSVIEGLCAADAAILLVSAADGPMAQTREHILLARQMRVENLVIFLSKADLNDDPELLELIMLETRELLNSYQLKGDDFAVVTGSAKAALDGDEGPTGKGAIGQLLQAVDALPASRRRAAPAAAVTSPIQAEAYVLTTEEGGLRETVTKPWPVTLFFESGVSAQAVVTLQPGSAPIAPGENCQVICELTPPQPVDRVTRFAIRDADQTLGAGVVTAVA